MSKLTEIMDRIETDGYICPECGKKMEFADEEVLVCQSCQYSCDRVDYVDVILEAEGFYENDEPEPETYEEVYGSDE